MATVREVENGIFQPFIDEKKKVGGQLNSHGSKDGGLWMVFLSTFVAVCGSFEFGTCVGYSAPTQYGIMEELGLSYAEYSIFGSILNIGAMIGAITSGRIADFIGRKGAMRMSSIICIVGWVAVYFALGPLLLNFGRFLTGYATGILSYVVPVFISELAPKDLRGALATANQLLICTGLSVAYTIGAFVTWRILALTGIVPCVVLLVGLCYIPESPRWLAMVGNVKEFEAALQHLRGPNADISTEAADIQESIAFFQHLPKVTVLDLVQRRNFRFVIIGVGLMVLQQFGGINGIVFYAAQIFVSAGVSPNFGSIISGILQVVVTAFGASLIDRAGRRPLLMISISGMLLGCLLTGTSFLLKAHQSAVELVPILAITGVMVYLGFFGVGMGAIPWVIMSEIFPINLKGIAGALVTLVNWMGAWAVSYTFNFLMGWSSQGTFYGYGAVCAMGLIFIIKIVPETKGRTLEEIQASMN